MTHDAMVLYFAACNDFVKKGKYSDYAYSLQSSKELRAEQGFG